jgi:hypothetical protein
MQLTVLSVANMILAEMSTDYLVLPAVGYFSPAEFQFAL